MLFDAAVMCGGKNQLLARFECSPLLHPASEVQHWLQLDRGSPAQGTVCMCGTCTLLRFLAKPLVCSSPLTQLPVFSREAVGSGVLCVPTLFLFLAPGSV